MIFGKGGEVLDKLIPILPMIGVIIGALIAGISSFVVQSISFKQQQKWEQEKLDRQFAQEQEKIDKQFAREQMLKKIDAYNKILSENNNTQVVEWDYYTGETTFKSERFEQLIRPLLYNSFHLLEQDVANAVVNIDNLLMKWEVLGEGDEEDIKALNEHYQKIISSIERQLIEYRMGYIEKV